MATTLLDPRTLEPDYLPEELLYRESQLNRLAMAIKPSIHGSNPLNCLCLGPPATGKTSAIRYVFRDLVRSGYSGRTVPVYINCMVFSSKQQIFSKIFQSVRGYPPPSRGISFSKLFHSVLHGLNGRPMIVALDDINTLDDEVLNDVLFSLLKAHEEVPVKTGVICISTDLRIVARLDPGVGSVFHAYEIYFPPYGREEMRDILWQRVELAFNGRIDDEAFERIVDESFGLRDLRYGIHLLRLAGLEAASRNAKKVGVRDVEEVIGKAKAAFIEKSLAALNEEEKALLDIIYDSDGYAVTTLYKKLREKTNTSVGYAKFSEILYRLERMRLIDFTYEKNSRKIVVRMFDDESVAKMLRKPEDTV